MAWKRTVMAGAMLMMASMACIVTDAKDVVDTASKAISLLEEIAESGTWTYISEGLEALDTAGGFSGTVDITRGTSNDTGETITEVTESLRWSIDVDADGDSRVTEVRDDELITIITVDDQSYRDLGDGSYECVVAGQSGDFVFASSLEEAFASYAVLAAGVQAISIAEEDGSETVNGRATTRYRLISKLEEALEILAEFPSEDLQQSLEDVPEFYVDGALYIDDETAALMRFDATYADLDAKQGNQFTFEVTQLGNQPDISIDPGQITVACPSE